jgi:hypothetical protein
MAPAEITGPGHPVSTPDIPVPSKKHSQVSTPSMMSGVFFLAKEKIKMLDFKHWWGTISTKELEQLETLKLEERCRSFGLLFSMGLDGDNTLGFEG